MPNLSHINELTIASVEQGIANSGIAPLHSMRIWSCGHSSRRYCSRSHLRSRCGNKTNRTIPHEDIQMCQDSGTRGASFLTGGFYKFIYGTRCIFSLQTIKFIIPHGTLDKFSSTSNCTVPQTINNCDATAICHIHKFSMCRKTKRWAC